MSTIVQAWRCRCGDTADGHVGEEPPPGWSLVRCGFAGKVWLCPSCREERRPRSRKWPQWECFPPYGDSVWHGYTFDAEEDEYRSLCGRRDVPASDHDPRSRYLNRRGGRKADQPDIEDTTDHCAACVRVADGRGLLPYRGKWENIGKRKRRRRIARERARRTL